MLDEVPDYVNVELIDKNEERRQRDWYKVRKYVVNRIRKGLSQAKAARLAGVSEGFVSKWWNRWKRTKSWDSIRSRSTAPSNVRVKRYYHPDEIVAARRAHPEMGAQKLKAFLGSEPSHQTIHTVLVEEGLVEPGPKARRVWRSFFRKHSNSLWQMDFKELERGGPYLLSVIDDYTRMILASRVLDSVTLGEVRCSAVFDRE